MELRKDYLLNRWVIVSENRGKRPDDFSPAKKGKQSSCVFCKGHEMQNPPDVYRSGKDGNWKIRVFPNKFPAVNPKGGSIIRVHNVYYESTGDHGAHEVIIETPKHGVNFGDLKKKDLVNIFKTYSLRINELNKDPAAKYTCLFKNQGKDAGASINHPHSQLISFAMIPPLVAEKLEAIKGYSHCPYCDIIKKEKNSSRRCYENNSFFSFSPYASRFNYEIWVFPKKHILTFNDFDDAMYSDLAEILKKICKRLERENIDFDIVWYYSPKGKDMHFHLEVMPRVAIWAGFEIGFGLTINTVSPESAAKFYRGKA